VSYYILEHTTPVESSHDSVLNVVLQGTILIGPEEPFQDREHPLCCCRRWDKSQSIADEQSPESAEAMAVQIPESSNRLELRHGRLLCT
jgi:hypothetical protein